MYTSGLLIGVITLGVLGLNLLFGYTGLVSFGHALFIGVGAYTAFVHTGADFNDSSSYLAGLSYLGVFVLYLVMITSGLAMYAAESLPGAYMKSFQFLIPIYGNLQMARFIHHLVMWVLILFVTLHVYANALTSALEENGEVDSIFSGYKFVHRGDVEKELVDEAFLRRMAYKIGVGNPSPEAFGRIQSPHL